MANADPPRTPDREREAMPGMVREETEGVYRNPRYHTLMGNNMSSCPAAQEVTLVNIKV